VVIDSPKHTTCLLDRQSLAPLHLRLSGSSRDGQSFRLSAAKCTIGSASGCTLRLRAPGVLPLHCLILRGPCGVVARAVAADSRLNGVPFHDARLKPSDRLSFGPIEFVIEAPT
jgi:hypothetical protein